MDNFFSRLTERDRVLVAYTYSVALCDGIEYIRHYYEGNVHRWEFRLRPYITDFSEQIDHATRVEHRLTRAKRLLFNENVKKLDPVPEAFGKDGQATAEYLNRILGEVIIAGQNDLNESPLPALYAQFRDDPQKFVDIAWVRLVMDLHTHNIVTRIELLEIVLDEDVPRLHINLRAKHEGDDIILNDYCNLNLHPPLEKKLRPETVT